MLTKERVVIDIVDYLHLSVLDFTFLLTKVATLYYITW